MVYPRRLDIVPCTVQSCQTFYDPKDYIQSMEFSRPEYWSGLSFPSQGIFPTQGLNPGFPHCRQTPYTLNHQGSHFRIWT